MWTNYDLALISIARAKGLLPRWECVKDLVSLSIARAKELPGRTKQDLALLSIARAKGLPDHLGLHLNSFCDHHGFYEMRWRRTVNVHHVNLFSEMLFFGQLWPHYNADLKAHFESVYRMRMKNDLMWWSTTHIFPLPPNCR